MVEARAEGRHEGRAALLDRAIAHLSKRGLSNQSLRAVAAELGTSHRMLIYHFGSADRFWDALITQMGQHEREALRAAAAAGRIPRLVDVWAQMSSVGNLPFMRLMFEVYGRALRDRKRFRPFLFGMVGDWLATVGDVLHLGFDLSRDEAELEARLRLALLRGLLLDLLTTGDREGTQRALELFVERNPLRERRMEATE